MYVIIPMSENNKCYVLHPAQVEPMAEMLGVTPAQVKADPRFIIQDKLPKPAPLEAYNVEYDTCPK